MKKNKKQQSGFTLSALASQTNCTRETCRRKLNAAGIEVVPGKLYGLRDIQSAFHQQFQAPKEADPFRILVNEAAAVSFVNGWEQDMLKHIAIKQGLSIAQFEKLACHWFWFMAGRNGAWQMLHADEHFRFNEIRSNFKNNYESSPPTEVDIPIPAWVRAAARRRGLAHLLDDDTLTIPASELLGGD